MGSWSILHGNCESLQAAFDSIAKACPHCPHNDSNAAITKRANAKTEEAKTKHEEYDRQKAQAEKAAQASVEANSSLKKTAELRSSALKEKEAMHARVEKTETKLVQVSKPHLSSFWDHAYKMTVRSIGSVSCMLWKFSWI